MLKKIAIVSSIVVVLAVAALIGANSIQRLSGEDAPQLHEQDHSALSGPTLNRDYGSAFVGASTRSVAKGSQAGSDTVSRPHLPSGGSKVIKTATIEVEIPKGQFQSRFDRASAIAEELGGFVTESSVEGSGEGPASGTITIRIPAERHQAAIAGLKRLGTVTSRAQTGQDVGRSSSIWKQGSVTQRPRRPFI